MSTIKKSQPGRPRAEHPLRYQVRHSDEQMRAWQDAADVDQRDLQNWIRVTLDKEARLGNVATKAEMARAITASAIARGELVRQPCEVCGAEKADAHHPDYSKPLDVMWLCRAHHIAEHHRTGGWGRPPRGETPSSTFGIRVTADELARFKAAAEREGLPLGEWLRAAAELAIARGSTR